MPHTSKCGAVAACAQLVAEINQFSIKGGEPVIVDGPMSLKKLIKWQMVWSNLVFLRWAEYNFLCCACRLFRCYSLKNMYLILEELGNSCKI